MFEPEAFMHALNDYELEALLHECDYIGFSAYCLVQFGGCHALTLSILICLWLIDDEEFVCLRLIEILHELPFIS